MSRVREAPAGCIVYFMLSIVINLFILILRISALEVQNNSTLATTNYRTIPTASLQTTNDDTGATESAIAITTTTSSAATDAARRNTVGLDKKQSPRYQQPLVTDNLPTDENKPIAASLVKDQHDSDTDNNELEERDSVAIDLIDKTVATIIPVPPNDLMKLPNETRITHNIGAITIHTTNTLQRNTTTVSRDQLNSRAVIKSSSPSTMANNNTTSQKQHKPDAPMLNYIFDSHLANKHRHYDPRYGPHFDDVHVAEKVGNVSAQLGSIAYLNCRIRLLQDKTVTWLKREQNHSHIQLLTIGVQTYTFDKRFSVEFEYPNNWRLRIDDVNKTDEGMYECQISTHPPRAIRTQFHVKSPEVFIVDELEQPLADKYYEVNSTIELMCIVRHVSMLSNTVHWLHGKQMLNYDMTRGGISVKTDLMENGANSTLSIAKVRKTDTGNYTCSIGPNDYHTINVQVLKGESLAELYHGSSVSPLLKPTSNKWIEVLTPTIIIILSQYILNAPNVQPIQIT